MQRTDTDLLETALNELDLHTVLGHVAGYALTEMASERIRGLRPLSDAPFLRADLARVQDMVNLLAASETIPFDRLADVRPLLRKARIEGNFLAATELLSISEALFTSRSLRRFFTEHAALAPNVHAFVEPLVDERMLEKHINEAIDETGVVRDNASRELLSIRREIHDVSARLRLRLQRILKKFGEEEVLMDEFVTQRDGRFVLPVRVENKRVVPGIIHGVSQSGSTVFLEPAETFDMNNELSLLHNAELREVARILTTLTAEVAAHAHSIEQAFEIMMELDVAIARAKYAIDTGGLCPNIHDTHDIELELVRHPILAWQARTTKHTVVPLSVSFDEQSRGILISGPNAGGKTVAMKTIGLSLTMAMCGIFPLGTVRTNMRRIYTAIGDHQSIDSNLSTFSSQLIRLRDILSWCGPDVVVLVDEICAGTDPAEGGALAAGILESLLERKTNFVVTTHQSSLKQFALSRPSITNASLAFDTTAMKPTFRFLPGVPGNSYAFVLAEAVGIPDVVISRGRAYLGDRHDELEQSITAMQTFRAEAEQAYRQAAEQALKAERVRADYEERLTAIKQQRAKLMQDARAEAADIIQQSRSLVENTIREIREQQRAAAEVKKTFEQGRTDLLAAMAAETVQEPTTPAGEQAITVGMTVTIDGTSNVGSVLSIDKAKHAATVDVNGIKFTVPLASLRAGGSVRKERRDEVFMKFDSRTSCDLRGKRVDEAIKDLEYFISDAILGGLTSATIIHGKGTGALRKAVQELFSEHPHIRSFRPGLIEEGGDGVTIVEII